MTDKKTLYRYEYEKKALKRVPLDMQKSDYEVLANAAKSAGIPVNTFIKQAIAEKMERDGYNTKTAEESYAKN